MKLLLIISINMAVIMIGLVSLTHFAESNTVTVQYDCRQLIGGWPPDVPVAVQEQCKTRRTNAGSKTRN